MRWVLLKHWVGDKKNGFLFGPYWFWDSGDTIWYQDKNSPVHFVKDEETDKILCEDSPDKEYEDLDHTKTALLKLDSEAGWLDRSGRFYGCSSYEHDTVAWLILHESVAVLEEAGWVRIYGIDEHYCSKRLSPEQRNWLSKHGHAIELEE